jgi:ABC-type transport system involved in multi-copper enzyme maturation permease subunit
VAPGRPIPSPFVAVVGYTLRACLPARRWFGVLVPCAAALLFGALTGQFDPPRTRAFADIAEQGLFGLILPLTCLVIGDAVLGADVRAGTFQLTWLSPVRFWVIAVGRWLGGWIVALVTLVPALALSTTVGGVSEAAGPMAIAAAAGSAAYIALFLMLGVVVKRSAVWALAVVLIGERLLGAQLSGVGQLSPMWEADQTFAGLWSAGDRMLRDGIPDGWAGVIRLAIITAVCLAIATWRLAHMRPFAGDD